MTNWPDITKTEAKHLGLERQWAMWQLEKEEEKKAGQKKQPQRECPLEEDEQIKLAEYLDYNNYCWCHVPNGGARHPATGAKMKKQGVKPGVPDVLIFDHVGICNGVAIELKRQKGGKLRETQVEWLDKLDARGWYTTVCHGADEAIDWLESRFEEAE